MKKDKKLKIILKKVNAPEREKQERMQQVFNILITNKMRGEKL